MDCNACQSFLIDVACGDSSASSQDIDRASHHALACTECGPALKKLQRGLALAAQMPLVDPSSKSTERIMQMARNHVVSSRAFARPAEPSRTFADRLREFLSQFAMGRQVAMATVMVLVTAVGVWFVPRARHHELAGGNVVNPDTDGEAGPSNGIVPAAPLDLDLRQGRIRAREEESLQRRTRDTASASESADDLGVPELDRKKATANLDDVAEADQVADSNAEQALGGTALDDLAAEPAPLAEAHATRSVEASGPVSNAPSRPSPKSALNAEALGYGLAESPARASGRGLGAAEGSLAAAASATPQRTPSAPPMPAAARPAPAASRAADEAVESEAPDPTEARKGVDTVSSGAERFHAGDYRGAIDLLEDAARARGGQLPASARLSLARSYARIGRCDEAVANYEKFLRVVPLGQDAMLEAATCYRQLGRTAEANQWTARAAELAPATTSKSATTSKAEPSSPAGATQQ